MSKHNVSFLYARSGGGGHFQADVAEARQLAAALTGEADDLEAAFPGPLRRLRDVGGIAAGADGQQQVAGAAQRFHLAGEDAVELVVVGPGG